MVKDLLYSNVMLTVRVACLMQQVKRLVWQILGNPKNRQFQVMCDSVVEDDIAGSMSALMLIIIEVVIM